MSWDTSGNLLYYTSDSSYNSGYYKVTGFSLTGTEYMAALYPNLNWFDFELNLEVLK